MAQKKFNIVKLNNEEEAKRFTIKQEDNELPLEITNVETTSPTTPVPLIENLEEPVRTILETTATVPIILPNLIIETEEIFPLSEQIKINNEICKQVISAIENKKLKKTYILLNKKKYEKIRNQYYLVQNLGTKLLMDCLNSLYYLDHLRQILRTSGNNQNSNTIQLEREEVGTKNSINSFKEEYKAHKDSINLAIIEYQHSIMILKNLHTQLSTKLIIGYFLKKQKLPFGLEIS